MSVHGHEEEVEEGEGSGVVELSRDGKLVKASLKLEDW